MDSEGQSWSRDRVFCHHKQLFVGGPARVGEVAQEQREDNSSTPLRILHDQQKVDTGGGAQQAYLEVPAGRSEFLVIQ